MRDLLRAGDTKLRPERAQERGRDEKRRIEFRAEFFNVFNHPQFLSPRGDITEGENFCRVTRAHDLRQAQFALKFFFKECGGAARQRQWRQWSDCASCFAWPAMVNVKGGGTNIFFLRRARRRAAGAACRRAAVRARCYASLNGGMKRTAPAAYELRTIAATVAAAIAS
jgi:hypothetical protein